MRNYKRKTYSKESTHKARSQRVGYWFIQPFKRKKFFPVMYYSRASALCCLRESLSEPHIDPFEVLLRINEIFLTKDTWVTITGQLNKKSKKIPLTDREISFVLGNVGKGRI
jgi:hypothetical protein